MPRNPRKRGKGKNDKNKRGISKEQICIETAIDRKGNILMGAVCNGRITTNQIVNFFDNKICEGATFCVDSHKSYVGQVEYRIKASSERKINDRHCLSFTAYKCSSQ